MKSRCPGLPAARLGTLLRVVALALCGLGIGDLAAAQGQPQNLPATTLNAGMHNIRAQVAVTPDQRQWGLMFRREMPTHEGMLFVFEAPAQQCFWMRNTPLPLSIAFIEDDGTILQITDMAPRNDSLHCSQRPVRFALEMEQGWFARKGLAVGAKLGGLPTSR